MTETVVVIEVDSPVSEAFECFGHYGIHHLPVVRQGRLVGMLSSADLRKFEHFAPRVNGARYLDERFRLDQFMHTPVVRVTASTTIAEAARTLIAAGVHALPVADAADRVVGIVSSTDFIHLLLRGPPRRGSVDAVPRLKSMAATMTGDEALDEPAFHSKPADREFATALATAETLHVENRDPRFLGKTLLYLAKRRLHLEKVLVLADRFLRAGQDEHHHAQLLKAILAAKRAEERASGAAGVPVPVDDLPLPRAAGEFARKGG
jgi:CBS domain-containing protein